MEEQGQSTKADIKKSSITTEMLLEANTHFNKEDLTECIKYIYDNFRIDCNDTNNLQSVIPHSTTGKTTSIESFSSDTAATCSKPTVSSLENMHSLKDSVEVIFDHVKDKKKESSTLFFSDTFATSSTVNSPERIHSPDSVEIIWDDVNDQLKESVAPFSSDIIATSSTVNSLENIHIIDDSVEIIFDHVNDRKYESFKSISSDTTSVCPIVISPEKSHFLNDPVEIVDQIDESFKLISSDTTSICPIVISPEKSHFVNDPVEIVDQIEDRKNESFKSFSSDSTSTIISLEKSHSLKDPVGKIVDYVEDKKNESFKSFSSDTTSICSPVISPEKSHSVKDPVEKIVDYVEDKKNESFKSFSSDTISICSSVVISPEKSHNVKDPVDSIVEYIKARRNGSCKLKEKYTINNNSPQKLLNSKHFKYTNFVKRKSNNYNEPVFKKIKIDHQNQHESPVHSCTFSAKKRQSTCDTKASKGDIALIKSAVSCAGNRRTPVNHERRCHEKSASRHLKIKNLHISVSLPETFQCPDNSNNFVTNIPKPSRQFFFRESETETSEIKPEDVCFHIIQWETIWLKVQKRTNKQPLICKLSQVKNNYWNFKEYSDTYYGLNLLTIWLNMYESWANPTTSIYARLESYEDKAFYVKNRCTALFSGDIPRSQDVILLSFNTVRGGEVSLFGFISRVKVEHDSVSHSRSGRWKEVTFYFYTVKRIVKSPSSQLQIRILVNIRLARNQCLALQYFPSSYMRDVIVDPKRYAQDSQVISLPSKCSPEQLQLTIDNIDFGTSERNPFNLLVQPRNVDSVLIILKLIRSLLKKRCTILVCLRSSRSCFKIAELLKSDFILAVKQSEVDIPHNLKKYTLCHLARKMNELDHDEAKAEIVRKSKILLTVMSYSFFADNSNKSFGSNLTCIIDEAHFCTEAETALPLSCEPNIVILLGNPKTTMELHPFLQSRGYHYSLFHRMFKSKFKTH